jgi:hypothetical protein
LAPLSTPEQGKMPLTDHLNGMFTQLGAIKLVGRADGPFGVAQRKRKLQRPCQIYLVTIFTYNREISVEVLQWSILRGITRHSSPLRKFPRFRGFV